MKKQHCRAESEESQESMSNYEQYLRRNEGTERPEAMDA